MGIVPVIFSYGSWYDVKTNVKKSLKTNEKEEEITMAINKQIPFQRHFLVRNILYDTKKNILGHKKYESILRHVIPSQSTFPAANLENIPLSSAREKGPKRYGPLTAIARVASSHPTPNPSALHLQRRSCTGLEPKPSAGSLARDAPFPVVQQWPFF